MPARPPIPTRLFSPSLPSRKSPTMSPTSTPPSPLTSFIPYTSPPPSSSTPFHTTPRLQISIRAPNGHTFHHATQMDTGSTGMIISALELGYRHPSELTGYEYSYHYLSSSKIYYEGYWIPVQLSFCDGGVKSDVCVFAVVRAGKCEGFEAGGCREFKGGTGRDMPGGIAYLGVGFGRMGEEQPGSRGSRNPLVNISWAGGGDVIKGRWEQGYVITERGVHVGLTRELRRGFPRVCELREMRNRGDRDGREWSGIPMTLHLSREFPNVEGTILFDSGIEQMYLGIPRDAYTSLPLRKVGNSTRVKDGTQFTISVGGKENASILEWPVTVGADEMTTPKMVLPRVKRPGMAFINSGRNFFKRHDLLFDAERGLVGLRRREAVEGWGVDAFGRGPSEKL